MALLTTALLDGLLILTYITNVELTVLLQVVVVVVVSVGATLIRDHRGLLRHRRVVIILVVAALQLPRVIDLALLSL